MTEHEIELQAERAMDRLDRQLLRNELSQAEYDAAVRSLDAETEARLAHRFGVRN